MSQLKARCIDQVLTFENTPVITSGDVNYDSIMFDFCSRWDGFTKTAIFYRSEDEVYYQLLDDTNTCIIPNEVLTEKGDIFIGVFGVSGDTTLTSQVLKYKITRGAITENLKPSDPTPDIYAQILSRYAEIIAELERQFQKLEDLQSQYTGAVGNADTLNGHKDTYFAKAEDIPIVDTVLNATSENPIANSAVANGLKDYFAFNKVIGGGNNETIAETIVDLINNGKRSGYFIAVATTDCPNSSKPYWIYYYSDRSTTGNSLIIAVGVNNPKEMYITNVTNSTGVIGSWQDLSNYLPLSGGTLESSASNVLLRMNHTGTASSALLEFLHQGTRLGSLGFNERGAVTVRDSKWYDVLDTGNMADHVLTLKGGRVGNPGVTSAPLEIIGNATAASIIFHGSRNNRLGSLGFVDENQPIYTPSSGSGAKHLLHTGNSAKVVIGPTAPSDTSALWIDTN